MTKQKTNWNQAKREFLFGKYTSLKDVADKYGLSYGYIRKLSMRKDWMEDKKAFWKEADKVINKEIERQVTKNLIRRVRDWNKQRTISTQ